MGQALSTWSPYFFINYFTPIARYRSQILNRQWIPLFRTHSFKKGRFLFWGIGLFEIGQFFSASCGNIFGSSRLHDSSKTLNNELTTIKPYCNLLRREQLIGNIKSTNIASVPEERLVADDIFKKLYGPYTNRSAGTNERDYPSLFYHPRVPSGTRLKSSYWK